MNELTYLEKHFYCLPCVLYFKVSAWIFLLVGNPNRKKMHIFGFVGIFEYICKTTFNIIFSMCTEL